MILSRVITLANNLPRVFAWVPDEFVRDRGWRFTTDDYGTASNAVHPTPAPFLKTPTSERQVTLELALVCREEADQATEMIVMAVA